MLFILIGGMGDWGGLRKKLLIVFSMIGAVFSCLFVSVSSSIIIVNPTLANMSACTHHFYPLFLQHIIIAYKKNEPVLSTSDFMKGFFAFCLILSNVAYGASFICNEFR